MKKTYYNVIMTTEEIEKVRVQPYCFNTNFRQEVNVTIGDMIRYIAENTLTVAESRKISTENILNTMLEISDKIIRIGFVEGAYGKKQSYSKTAEYFNEILIAYNYNGKISILRKETQIKEHLNMIFYVNSALDDHEIQGIEKMVKYAIEVLRRKIAGYLDVL